MSAEPHTRDVNDLRERLRALGYLDARVDRFILGGAVGRRRAVSLAVAASIRIGLLAGVLLGPAAVIGLATRVSGLVTTVSDATVLAVYLAVPFGLASGVLACLAILGAGWLARRHASAPAFASRARRASITAGLTVGAACLLYLTLWWRAAVPPDTWTAPVLALAVAAAIAVLIGHVVTISVLAYLARMGLTALPAGSPLSSWRVVVPLGAIALAGAMALLRTLAPSAESLPPAAPALTVVPTGIRATVIAVDGVDVSMLARLRAGGSLPVFDRLLGSASAPLAADVNRDPAQVWTTLATGQPVQRHGIRALEGRQLAGVEGRVDAGSMLTTATDLLRLTRPTLASGDDRRVPTFWEVAASAGLRTAVVHWWATWPAIEVHGTVLSDRAILRLEHGGDLSAEIAPVSLYDPLLSSAAARTARVDGLVSSMVADMTPDVAGVMERSARLDATVLDLATDPALGPQDLLTVYLPGLDIAQHALFSAAPAGTLAAATAANRVRALELYYVFLDRALAGTVLNGDDPRHVIVLVTQPGRVVSDAGGLLAISGAVSPVRTTLAALQAETLAPTVLRALGVPVASDLGAGSAEPMFQREFRAAFPPRTVATYGERRLRATRTAGRPLDTEMIERMRSLGYVR